MKKSSGGKRSHRTTDTFSYSTLLINVFLIADGSESSNELDDET